MKSCGVWFLVVLALLVGLATGLLVGWVVWPVQWTDASPEGLQSAWRLEWLNMAADSYARNPNAELAQQRSAALGKFAPEALSTLQAGAQGDRAAEINAFAEALASGSPVPEQPASQQQPSANDLVSRLLQPPLFGYVAAGLFLALLAVVLLVVLVIRLFSGGKEPAVEAPLAPEPILEAERSELPIVEMGPTEPITVIPETEAVTPVEVSSETPQADQGIGPLENAAPAVILAAPIIEELVESVPASEPVEENSIPEPDLEMPALEALEPVSEELEVADLEPETPAEPALAIDLPKEQTGPVVSQEETPSEIPAGIEWALEEEAPAPVAALVDDVPAEIEAVAQETPEIDLVEPVETPDLQAVEQAVEEELADAEGSGLAVPPVQANEWIPERDNEGEDTDPPIATQFNRPVSEIQGIGSEYYQVLAAQGIDTLHAFLQRCASARGRQGLAEKTGLSGKLIARWARQADLLRIRGLSPQAAELFELAGVTSIRDLAGRKAEQLTQKLLEINQVNTIMEVLPSQAMVEEWIEQAKDLPRILDN